MKASEAKKLCEQYTKYSCRLRDAFIKIREKAFYGYDSCYIKKLDRLDVKHLVELGYRVYPRVSRFGALSDYEVYW